MNGLNPSKIVNFRSFCNTVTGGSGNFRSTLSSDPQNSRHFNVEDKEVCLCMKNQICSPMKRTLVQFFFFFTSVGQCATLQQKCIVEICAIFFHPKNVVDVCTKHETPSLRTTPSRNVGRFPTTQSIDLSVTVVRPNVKTTSFILQL